MTDIKVRIDYNIDPNIDNKAKQVVYLEKTLNEIDITNLIGKKITNVEYEQFHNCLILTLADEMPLLGAISGSVYVSEIQGYPSASLKPINED